MQHGTLVIYHPVPVFPTPTLDQQAAKQHLQPGRVYTVQYIEEGKYEAYAQLKELPGTLINTKMLRLSNIEQRPEDLEVADAPEEAATVEKVEALNADAMADVHLALAEKLDPDGRIKEMAADHLKTTFSFKIKFEKLPSVKAKLFKGKTKPAPTHRALLYTYNEQGKIIKTRDASDEEVALWNMLGTMVYYDVLMNVARQQLKPNGEAKKDEQQPAVSGSAST